MSHSVNEEIISISMKNTNIKNFRLYFYSYQVAAAVSINEELNECDDLCYTFFVLY